MNILSKLNLKSNLLDLKHTFSFKFVFIKKIEFSCAFCVHSDGNYVHLSSQWTFPTNRGLGGQNTVSYLTIIHLSVGG